MKKSAIVTGAMLIVVFTLCAAGCSPRTAREIVARSVAVHGGAKLTSWKTMTVQGTVDMFDGNMFTGTYLVYAQTPDKLRVEQNMTTDIGGRFFYEHFLNGGAAWSRRNLISGSENMEQMKRWMNQCYGIAYYADHSDSLTRLEDGTVEWKARPEKQSQEYRTVATRPAYVIRSVAGKQTVDLYIDKQTYHLLEEAGDTWKRVYWDFKQFESVVLPTKINEVAVTKRGENITPYTYGVVKYDVPIEQWLFTEEMPETSRQPAVGSRQ